MRWALAALLWAAVPAIAQDPPRHGRISCLERASDQLFISSTDARLLCIDAPGAGPVACFEEARRLLPVAARRNHALPVRPIYRPAAVHRESGRDDRSSAPSARQVLLR
jgi:hypothetical protein